MLCFVVRIILSDSCNLYLVFSLSLYLSSFWLSLFFSNYKLPTSNLQHEHKIIFSVFIVWTFITERIYVCGVYVKFRFSFPLHFTCHNNVMLMITVNKSNKAICHFYCHHQWQWRNEGGKLASLCPITRPMTPSYHRTTQQSSTPPPPPPPPPPEWTN